jgi:hypothetical protein
MPWAGSPREPAQPIREVSDGAVHLAWAAPFQVTPILLCLMETCTTIPGSGHLLRHRHEGRVSPQELIVGAGHVDRVIANADDLLLRYRKDTGRWYLDCKSTIPRSILAPEDLAVTLLVNSQAGWRAFRSLQENGAEVDLTSLPTNPLEQTTVEERCEVAALIATVASWPGFKASLDQIRCALDWIAFDLARVENASAWDTLKTLETSRSRIQLFDSIWWTYFRMIQPVLDRTLVRGTT